MLTLVKYSTNMLMTKELEAIVHSIVGRTWALSNGNIKKLGTNSNLPKPTDKELHEVAKGLRKPQ